LVICVVVWLLGRPTYMYLSTDLGFTAILLLLSFRPLISELDEQQTLTAYIFGIKHDIDNRASALTTRRGLLHRLKTTRTLVHKRLQTRPPFLSTLRRFCFLLYCQASQMDISKRNSTKLCQTVGSKSR